MSPICKSHFDQLSNPRWQRAFNHGARPQQLLWASTGTRDAGWKSVE